VHLDAQETSYLEPVRVEESYDDWDNTASAQSYEQLDVPLYGERDLPLLSGRTSYIQPLSGIHPDEYAERHYVTGELEHGDFPEDDYHHDDYHDDEYDEPEPELPAAGRAMPQRIEPAEVDDEPVAPAPRKSRRGKKVVLSLLTLVVVVGLGVAGVGYFAPSVANRVGLPTLRSSTNAQDVSYPAVADAVTQLKSLTATGSAPTSAGVKSALASALANSALGTYTGTVVDPGTGSTLWSHNASTAQAPASTNKLLTSAAALLSLDLTKRLETKIVAGSSPGEVILVGGGDPTLSSLPVGKESIYPGAAHLDDLVAQAKQAAGGSVTKVDIDTSLYSGDSMAPGWQSSDIQGGSIAPISAAMLDGGRTVPTADEDKPRYSNPTKVLLTTLANRLGATAGSEVSAPSGAKVLASVKSPPVSDLIDILLRISDNVLAEALGRQVALATGQPASFTGEVAGVTKTLSSNGFDTTNVSLVDSSGLSTSDRITSELLGNVLAAAAKPDSAGAKTLTLRPLLDGLPVAGGTGTLSDRFTSAGSTAGRGYVRAKTGTLNVANALAGIVLTKDNRILVFVIMTTGTGSSASRPAMDAVAASLRGCGCSS
jgi:D-alanyl-D-alanine carboxypeptidase/D-alanyl-D-alanine-endopeptidase (penicillin-binding protein 4)